MIPAVERVAVIDMGSNSWRLVVFGYEPGTPWWSLVDEIREAVRVAAGVGATGALRPERVELALHTAAVFSAFCRATEVDEVEAVATSAFRDASNGDELLADIERTTGLQPRVISGEEEARYGWLAIANSTTIEDGFGLDIGGGSIQTLRLERRRMVDARSLPLGAVRVSERFLPGERATGKEIKALRKHVAEELDGLGGTIRNLAAAAMKRLDLPDIDVQGFALTRDALGELIEELAERPVSKRAQVKGIKYDRADVILGGALVLDTALEQGGFDSIEVTEAGLREGVFFDRLLGGRELFGDVRAESVRNLAHRFEHHAEHDQHVWALSREMFDGLAAAGLHEYGEAERELLCGVIRLAEQLERSRDRAITGVRVSAHDSTVSLEADTHPSRDATVPIWAARRNAGLLAEALGRDVEIAG